MAHLLLNFKNLDLLKTYEKKRRPSFSFLLLGLSLFLSSYDEEALGFQAEALNIPWKKSSLNNPANLDEDILRPSLVEGSSDHGQAWYDRLTGALRLQEFTRPLTLEGIHEKSGLSEVSKKAAEYLAINYATYGVRAEDLRLKTESTIFNTEQQFIKFDVLRDGLVIKNANIDVRLFKGKIKQIVLENYSEATPIKAHYQLSQASTLASRVISADFKVVDQAYKVKKSSEGYQLIPEAVLRGISANKETFRVSINLESGQLTELSADKFHIDIPVVIRGFKRNAREAFDDAPYVNGKLISEDEKKQISTDLNSNIKDGDYFFNGLEGIIGQITSSDPTYALNVKAEKFKNELGHEVLTIPRFGGQFSLANDVNMAFATVYSTLYKIKSTVDRSAKALSPWVMKPSRAFVNENNECNAYYVRRDADSPKAGSLNFFQGLEMCNNTGNMADVIAHEWGHGLDDNTGGIEDRAFSEGFGDIMAYVMYFKPDIGFDLKKDGKPIRNIAEFKKYPNDQGEFHKEGQIISNTFYELHLSLRSLLPAPEADALVRLYAFSMIKNARKYTDVHDFLMAFENRNKIRCVINEVFTRHGLGRTRQECPDDYSDD